jgi:hypothetical protein
MVAVGVNRHAVASKQAGPASIGISLAIFGISLAILLGHVADHASRRYEYARFGAGPVTTCGPAHFASVGWLKGPGRRSIP